MSFLKRKPQAAAAELPFWKRKAMREMTREEWESLCDGCGRCCLNKLVEEDFQDGVARGIARTPTVLVNGEPFIETFSVEELSKSIDAALTAVKPAQ